MSTSFRLSSFQPNKNYWISMVIGQKYHHDIFSSNEFKYANTHTHTHILNLLVTLDKILNGLEYSSSISSMSHNARSTRYHLNSIENMLKLNDKIFFMSNLFLPSSKFILKLYFGNSLASLFLLFCVIISKG